MARLSHLYSPGGVTHEGMSRSACWTRYVHRAAAPLVCHEQFYAKCRIQVTSRGMEFWLASM